MVGFLRSLTHLQTLVHPEAQALVGPAVTDWDHRLLAACGLRTAFPQVNGKRICLFVLGIALPSPKHKLNIHEPPMWIGYLLHANTKSPFCMRCPGAGQSRVSVLTVDFPDTVHTAVNQLWLPAKAVSQQNKDKDSCRAVGGSCS